jgi:hypothetical protein
MFVGLGKGGKEIESRDGFNELKRLHSTCMSMSLSF